MELALSDATEYEFPEGAGGVISTFALTLVPAFDDVIRRATGVEASDIFELVVARKPPA